MFALVFTHTRITKEISINRRKHLIKIYLFEEKKNKHGCP